MNIKLTKTCSASLLVLLASSCAQDGFDDNERFVAGVSNAQLQSPEISADCFSTLTNPDGTESVKFTWPLVMGAGGYQCSVNVVDDPSNPEALITDSIVDGTTVTFVRREDTKYEVSVKTLGNPKYNNTEAPEATVYAYSTLVPALTIPTGVEISQWIAENLVGGEGELGFELQGGATYKLDGTLDFGLNTVTFRGDKTNRPTVEIGENGKIMTQAGLKIKYVNFDCTNTKSKALLELSDKPDDVILNKNYPTKYVNASNDCYIIENPIVLQDCNIKNLPNSLIFANKKPYGIRDFRVDNCIIQLNNSGSNAFINLDGSNPGIIKNMVMKNSTIYNLVKNSSAFFFKYGNASGAQPMRSFGEADNSTAHTIQYCTFGKTFSNKDFANQMLNNGVFTQIVDHCIFYDVYRLYQYLLTNNKRTTTFNTIHYVDGSPQSNDTGGRKDNQGNPYTILDDPQFVGPFLQEFDLTQAKGGVNFRPTSAYTVQNQIGDPRWFE